MLRMSGEQIKTAHHVTLSYTPHPNQQPFHDSLARFRMLNCGRRWGKTLCGTHEAFKRAMAKRGSVGFIVAPTYWHTTKCWREFLKLLDEFPKDLGLITKINRAERLIILDGDRYIWFKSADNPDSLRSEGLDWLWVDECAEVKEEAWTLALRPALMDKHGIAWFTTTPKGHNWFYQLWMRGQDPDQPDYMSWIFPSVSNPYLDEKEINDFARDMPPLAYRQEILGEFTEDIGAVFRNVRGHVKPLPLGPQLGVQYVVGVDIAKHEDFTVLIAIDVMTGEVHGFERFQKLDWVFQRKRIVAFCVRFNNARLLIDASGVGDPVLDELFRENVRVDPYKFTQATKKDLIENLSVMLDNSEIWLPEISVLVDELVVFGFTRTKSGNFNYSAPSGYHDDTVIALALAAWQLRHVPKGVISVDFARRARHVRRPRVRRR